MARGMSRRDKFILQFILIVALATFLFGVWAMIVGVPKPPGELTPQPSVPTNPAVSSAV
jgi:hypothetical protein